jgi:hypothetical protein
MCLNILYYVKYYLRNVTFTFRNIYVLTHIRLGVLSFDELRFVMVTFCEATFCSCIQYG